MLKHNPNDEQTKHRYLTRSREAKRYDVKTVDSMARSIARFEADTQGKDFKSFEPQQAIDFKRRLLEHRNERTGELLSKSTVHTTLSHVRRFFEWLAQEPGYRSHLKWTDAEFFNLSAKDVRIATAHRVLRGPSMAQIGAMLDAMPHETPIELRDRAVVACIVLTAARDGALASLKHKHIDLDNRRIDQDAREVRTKNSKTFDTYLLPVGDDICRIFFDWITWLREDQKFGDDDPLFPATKTGNGPDQSFMEAGLSRDHWTTTEPIREIFLKACKAAGLPYFNPHSFRNTLARYGLQICRTQAEMKAWSQNMGHSDIATTLGSYGTLSSDEQGRILRSLGERGKKDTITPEKKAAMKALLVEMLSDFDQP